VAGSVPAPAIAGWRSSTGRGAHAPQVVSAVQAPAIWLVAYVSTEATELEAVLSSEAERMIVDRVAAALRAASRPVRQTLREGAAIGGPSCGEGAQEQIARAPFLSLSPCRADRRKTTRGMKQVRRPAASRHSWGRPISVAGIAPSRSTPSLVGPAGASRMLTRANTAGGLADRRHCACLRSTMGRRRAFMAGGRRYCQKLWMTDSPSRGEFLEAIDESHTANHV